jgi:hypothetical protein
LKSNPANRNGFCFLLVVCLQPLIPVLLLVLGANLSNGPQLASRAHLPALNVAAVIGSKLILSPLLGLGLILGAQKFGVIGAATDPLAVLVMMVAWSTPTAVLVHSLSLVHKNGGRSVCAAVLRVSGSCADVTAVQRSVPLRAWLLRAPGGLINHLGSDCDRTAAQPFIPVVVGPLLKPDGSPSCVSTRH